MQHIQIDGIYTYINNIKNLKIGDKIKLLKNSNNRYNSSAIGAYTLDNKKIGYIPFKINQIDINIIFKVTKINLTINNPILIISIDDLQLHNFIFVENDYIIKYKKSLDITNSKINNEIKNFKKYLERLGHIIDDIYISYYDDNFIDINIINDNNNILFNTVTRKYYEENIFKYDIFFKNKLIPFCIYQPFLIHRLECYIIKNYKNIIDFYNKNKKKLEYLNCKFDITELDNILTNNKDIDYEIFKIILYKKINENLNYINLDCEYNIDFNIFINLFNNLQIGTLCYNHEYKLYCYIDFYDNDNIIDIINNNIDININFYLLKAIIANKKCIILYNPYNNKLYKYELNEIIINNIKLLLKKK